MRRGRAALWAAVWIGCAAAGVAQGPATAAPAIAVPAATAPPPSAVLQPALDAVRGTLAGVRTDKWKRGSVRDEAGTEIGSITTDMQVNLPPLVHDADAAPGMVSKQLALVRHVDALYDVLLRVVEAARISAPGDQAGALQQALETFGKARLGLYDAMLKAAMGEEKQVVDLRATVAKQAAFKCPAPPPVKPCPPPVHRRAKPKAAAPKKPAAPATGTAPKTKTP